MLTGKRTLEKSLKRIEEVIGQLERQRHGTLPDDQAPQLYYLAKKAELETLRANMREILVRIELYEEKHAECKTAFNQWRKHRRLLGKYYEKVS